MKKLATILGLGAAITAGIALADTTQTELMQLPKYAKKDTVVKSGKGDYQLTSAILQREGETIEFPMTMPHKGDWNKDGKYDWVLKMTFVDRNHDGKYDIVIEKQTKNNDPAQPEASGKRTVAWIDDDFDGRIDRVLIDHQNKKGKQKPDGKWDKVSIDKKLIGFPIDWFTGIANLYFEGGATKE